MFHPDAMLSENIKPRPSAAQHAKEVVVENSVAENARNPYRYHSQLKEYRSNRFGSP
jgi:hypothetical protein